MYCVLECNTKNSEFLAKTAGHFQWVLAIKRWSQDTVISTVSVVHLPDGLNDNFGFMEYLKRPQLHFHCESMKHIYTINLDGSCIVRSKVKSSECSKCPKVVKHQTNSIILCDLLDMSTADADHRTTGGVVVGRFEWDSVIDVTYSLFIRSTWMANTLSFSCWLNPIFVCYFCNSRKANFTRFVLARLSP